MAIFIALNQYFKELGAFGVKLDSWGTENTPEMNVYLLVKHDILAKTRVFNWSAVMEHRPSRNNKIVSKL